MKCLHSDSRVIREYLYLDRLNEIATVWKKKKKKKKQSVIYTPNKLPLKMDTLVTNAKSFSKRLKQLANFQER